MIIPLPRGYLVEIDDEDYEIIKDYTWYPYVKRSTAYAKTQLRVGDTKKYNPHCMSKFILGIVGRKDVVVDHIDGNGLNNRKSNLRLATHEQNRKNRKINSNSQNKYKGVMRIKGYPRFGAQITANGKHHYLGTFDTEEEAAVAYNKAAIKFFGEFARLNVIE